MGEAEKRSEERIFKKWSAISPKKLKNINVYYKERGRCYKMEHAD